MSNRRVLIVSFHFPPHGGAGTQRAAKLCKYLGRFGWDTSVICDGSDPDSTLVSSPRDEGLLKDLDSSVIVKRVRASSAAQWLQEAHAQLDSIVANESCDAAIVSMSPFWLAKLVPQLAMAMPTVVDLRDPWALDGVPTYRSYFEWRRDASRMRRTLNAASAVVMNTPESHSAVLTAFPELRSKPVKTIPNGFDPDDFTMARPTANSADPGFQLVHTGTFLTGQIEPPRTLKQIIRHVVRYRPEPIRAEGRTVRPILNAISLLRATDPAILERFRFTHVGPLDPATNRCIQNSGAADLVDTTGYISHEDSIGWLLNADALFLHLHGLPSGRRARIVPGKTYEYLASGRPILAALPQGDARDLAQAHERCVLADPCDSDSIAAGLRQLIKNRDSVTRSPLADGGLTMFTRKAIAGQFAELLDDITNPRSALKAGGAVK